MAIRSIDGSMPSELYLAFDISCVQSAFDVTDSVNLVYLYLKLLFSTSCCTCSPIFHCFINILSSAYGFIYFNISK